MPRLGPDPIEPGRDGGEAAEVDAALARLVGVGVKGDVGDGVRAGDEEISGAQAMPARS